MRIDKLLWFLRFAPRVRMPMTGSGRPYPPQRAPVERPATVAVGDVLVLPLPGVW
jgi:hypothetical protein